MTTDDTARTSPAGELPRRGAGSNPGRTILVTASGLLLAVAVVQPAFAYVQGSADGQPIDRDGTTDATTFEIDADRADIDVVAADGDVVEWSVDGGRATTNAEVTENGDTATLELGDARGTWGNIGPSFHLDWLGRSGTGTAQITVAVPEGTNVVVDSDFGNLDVQEAALGDLTVVSSFSNIRATGTAENLDLRLDYGDANASGLAVTGGISIRTDFGDVDLRSPEVPGAVDVETSFGDVTVALPPGPYAVSHTSDLGDVTNGLTIEAGGDQVPVRLHTSFGAVVTETY
ncbi:MAG: DUF4097 family beta strand repeat-containing protein [Actinomycetaceae bacterium]